MRQVCTRGADRGKLVSGRNFLPSSWLGFTMNTEPAAGSELRNRACGQPSAGSEVRPAWASV